MPAGGQKHDVPAPSRVQWMRHESGMPCWTMVRHTGLPQSPIMFGDPFGPLRYGWRASSPRRMRAHVSTVFARRGLDAMVAAKPGVMVQRAGRRFARLPSAGMRRAHASRISRSSQSSGSSNRGRRSSTSADDAARSRFSSPFSRLFSARSLLPSGRSPASAAGAGFGSGRRMNVACAMARPIR